MLKSDLLSIEEQKLVHRLPRARSNSCHPQKAPQISRTAYLLILKNFIPVRINTYRQGYTYPKQNEHLQETHGVGVATIVARKLLCPGAGTKKDYNISHGEHGRDECCPYLDL